MKTLQKSRWLSAILGIVAFLALLVPGTSQASEKEITVNFLTQWVGKDSKTRTIAEIIHDFNAQNQGRIRVVAEGISDYDAYASKIKTSISSGTVPDVFSFSDIASGPLYYKSGQLLDLTKYFNRGWKKQFLPGAFADVTYNKRIYAVPFEYGVAPALYNARLLAKVGFKEFPRTYSELFDLFAKLKAAGITPAAQMTKDNAWTSMLWYSQLLSAIGGPGVYKKGLNDPAFVEAAKVLKKLFDYTSGDAIGGNAGQAAAHFLNGDTAILLNGPWFIGRIKKEGKDNLYDDIRVAPLPTYEGGKGKPGQYIGFTQSVLAAARQSDPAKERAVVRFLTFLTQPAQIKKISLDSGAMFVVQFDVAANDPLDRLQAEMQRQLSKAPYVLPHFHAAQKAAVQTEFPQALEGLVLGKYTPQQFVEQLKKAADQ